MEARPVVKVLALLRRPSDGALLVERDVDPATGEPFERPLGGSVEFGETRWTPSSVRSARSSTPS